LPRYLKKPIQAKLPVSQPGDAFEQEADAAADESGVGSPFTRSEGVRIPDGSADGRPLPHKIQNLMEGRFDADFSGVRVHDDANAASEARFLNARAFTSGGDLVFGSGEFQPETRAGRRLVAHELTHVIQQAGPAGPAVQMKAMSATAATAPEIPGLRGSFSKWAALDEIKSPMIRALAKEYLNRPGKIEMADRIVRDTPYGGDKVIPGIHDPSEDRICAALHPVMNLKKAAKGDKLSDWFFKPAELPSEKKSAGEKGTEIGQFGVEQAISRTFKEPAVDLGLVGAKYVQTGKWSGASIAEAISEPAAKWIMKELLVTAEVAAKAIPVIGWLWLAYDVADLLISLGEPAEREVSPYQFESANIVAKVRAYLEGKDEAARLNEAIQHPFDPSKGLKPPQSDRLR
jgi:hypothetical protein